VAQKTSKETSNVGAASRSAGRVWPKGENNKESKIPTPTTQPWTIATIAQQFTTTDVANVGVAIVAHGLTCQNH